MSAPAQPHAYGRRTQFVIAALEEISRTRVLTDEESLRLEAAIRSLERKAPRRRRMA